MEETNKVIETVEEDEFPMCSYCDKRATHAYLPVVKIERYIVDECGEFSSDTRLDHDYEEEADYNNTQYLCEDHAY